MEFKSTTSEFNRCLLDYYSKSKPDANKIILFDKGKWQSVETTSSKIESLFKATIEELMSLDVTALRREHLEIWIRSVNFLKTEYDLKQKKMKVIKKTDVHIQFSSVKGYEWLSNFYSTLIYDPENQIIYPHVESAYVAFKARMADSSSEEIKEFAHTLDAKMVKQQGSHLWTRESEEDNQAAIIEMERLVGLKVSCNPKIQQWLTTATCTFEEFTSDPFWGTANGQIIDDNSNHLGKIIKRISDALKERV